MNKPQAQPGEQQQPVKKKKKGCCFGCLMIMLALLVLVLGTLGYYWYKSIPKQSEVEKEYHEIQDYFEK